MRIRVLILLVFGLWLSDLQAQQPGHEDPIQKHLFPPEVLMKYRGQLGLSNDQVRSIQQLAEKFGPQVQQHQAKLKLATDELIKLLDSKKVDEEAAINQLDKVISIEREVKRLHFRVMIQLRNLLDADQQKFAAKINQSAPQQPPEPEHAKRLKAKIARIQEKIESLVKARTPPPRDVIDSMKEFPRLMQTGKLKQAEELLDKTINLLGIDDEPLDKKPKKSSQSNRPKIKPIEQLTAKQVEAKIAALKKEDVAWRKIEWKTCLLDGLKASRDQKKPIVLWIFIDRPIDDERC